MYETKERKGFQLKKLIAIEIIIKIHAKVNKL